MIVAERHVEKFTTEEIESIRQSIRKGRSVRLSLPKWGWLYIDRKLPFLFLHRSPVEQRSFGTELLTLSEASALVIPEDLDQLDAHRLLYDTLVEELAEENRFLVVELSSGEVTDVEKPGRPVPVVRIEIVGDLDGDAELIRSLEDALELIEVLDQRPTVVCSQKDASETDWTDRSSGVTKLGLVLEPVWVNPETREPFPIVLRDFRYALATALKKTAWFFCRNETSRELVHYEELGRHEVLEEDWLVDRELSRISSRFEFLLDITPVNPRAALRELRESGWTKPPEFHYRRLRFDPEVAKGELYRIPLDEVEDATLHYLFREKRAELARTLTMLEQRNTPDFLYSSLQHYGPVTDELLEQALTLLRLLPAGRVKSRKGAGGVDAEGFAKLARGEIAFYRECFSGLSSAVEILPEITSLMVSGGNLYVPIDLYIPEGRIQALLQHEVGTHVVTWGNGKSQRLAQLHTGFAGYDELQEGLAVLAEYFVGELSDARMRLLAGRVVAVRRLIEGAGFLEIFHELRRLEFTSQQAFTITMRVCRSGGLTKDAVYLRGLGRILEYLGRGGDLDLLYTGKITEAHVGLVRELIRRRILQKPPLRPRYLDFAEAKARLTKIRGGAAVLDLIERKGSS
jgi:uncharacterized protein (TIGR02421 family)